MSELPLISDKQSLTTWLQQRPDRDAAVLAHRAAMRAAIIPLWALAISDGSSGDPRALNVLRCAMTSGLPLHFMDRDVIAACERAFQSGGSDNHLAANAALAAMSAPIVSTAQSASSRHTRTFASIEAAARAIDTHAPAMTMWRAVTVDILALEAEQEAQDAPLWPHTNPLSNVWAKAQTVQDILPSGDFWIDWYQRALDGRPQNWPLLRDIALIPDDLWDDGDSQLDREIRNTVERHRLLAQVRDLKAQLQEASSAGGDLLAHRGHNNPPELLDAMQVKPVKEINNVAAALDEAEQELQKQKPSSSILRQAAQQIQRAVVAVVSYCADIGDEVVKSAAKAVGTSVGKWAVGIAAASIVANQPAFMELVEALKQLAAAR